MMTQQTENIVNTLDGLSTFARTSALMESEDDNLAKNNKKAIEKE